MQNLKKIQNVSRKLNMILSATIIIVPVYYVWFWFIGSTFIVSFPMQLLGLFASLFPLFFLTFSLLNLKHLFQSYSKGIIFSPEHIVFFKKITVYLFGWAIFSIIYESIKSVIFSWDNATGKTLIVSINSDQIIILMVSAITLVIAWIIDEGRIINDDNKLVV